MTDERHALEARIRALPDEALIRMMTVECTDYREDALAYARYELRGRGVHLPIQPQRELSSTRSDRPRWNTIVAGAPGRLSKAIVDAWWVTKLAWVVCGVSVSIFFARPAFLQGTGIVYLAAVMFSSFALTDAGVYRNWRSASRSERWRAGFWGVLAMFLNVNALLYLVGMRTIK